MITEQESALLEQFATLFLKRRPVGESLTWLEGKQKVLQLCSRFNVPATGIVTFFIDPREVPTTLDRHLFKGLLQIVSIDERGFSEMNIICAPLRSKITIPHLSSLMFVSINGPPMYLWNSSAAFSEWLQKHVSAMDNNT